MTKNPSGMVALAALLVIALPAASATAAETQSFEIARAASPVRIDGVLDEAAWQQATVITVDHEWFPGDGPAPVATVALVTYDGERLYVAFRAVDRVGVRAGSADVERRIWGQPGDWFSVLFFDLSVDGTQEYGGAFNEWGPDVVLGYQGPRQSEVTLALAPNQEHFQGITYHNTRQSIFASFQPTGGSTLSMQVRWGEDIDVANNRKGDFVTLAPALDLRLGRHLQGRLDWIHQTFDVRGGRLFTVDLAQTRTSSPSSSSRTASTPRPCSWRDTQTSRREPTA